MTPIRLLVLTVPAHLYANQILTHLLRTRGVVAVLESGALLHRTPYFTALRRYLRVSGPSYVAHQGLKQWGFKLGAALLTQLRRGRPGDALFDYRRIARSRAVPVHRVSDVNGASALRLMREAAADLLVSVYFNQILGPESLGIAPLGAINVHPAPLPRYRGVSPVFWALANGEAEAGITVHAIDTGVDTGRILAQARLAVAPGDTEHSLYWRLTQAGIPLLDAVLDGFEAGTLPAAAADGEASYYSLPTRDAVARFRRGGRRFF